jgi:hypothetical protein
MAQKAKLISINHFELTATVIQEQGRLLPDLNADERHAHDRCDKFK